MRQGKGLKENTTMLTAAIRRCQSVGGSDSPGSLFFCSALATECVGCPL